MVIPQVSDVTQTEVMQSVDKWRRDESVVATQGSSAMPSQDPIDEIPPSEPDDMDAFMDSVHLNDAFPDSDPMVMDDVPTTSPVDGTGPSLPSSEEEVKSHLVALDTSSSPQDPLEPISPEQPSAVAEPIISSKPSTVLEDFPMDDIFSARTPPPMEDWPMPNDTPVAPKPTLSRTEQILADIRARAMREVEESDEEKPLEFGDIPDFSSSSSDDELDDDIFKTLKEGADKGKNKALVFSFQFQSISKVKLAKTQFFTWHLI